MPAIVDFETIPQLFRRLVDHYAGQGRTALSYKDRASGQWTDISWKDLERRVHELAGYLYLKGIRKGDRVAVLSENRPEWAITDLATQILGGVNVSLYTSLPPQQVAYIIRDSGAKILVVSTTIQLRKAKEVFDRCPDLLEVISMVKDDRKPQPFVRKWASVMEEGAAYWVENETRLRPIGDEVVPDDLSALIYTSGTTGNPKGVMLTHKNFCSNARSALEKIPFGPSDHHLSFLPVCHSFERTAGFIAVLACGARISYAESVDAVIRNLAEVRPTVLIAVPRIFEKVYNTVIKSVESGPKLKARMFHSSVAAGTLAAARRKRGKRLGPILGARVAVAHKTVFSKLHERLGGNVRFAISGSAALPQFVGEFFEAVGLQIIEGYGLTETAPVLSINPATDARFGTVGHIIPGVTVGIRSLDSGAIVGSLRGEDYPSDLTTAEGEIVAKGPNIMKGYWNNEEATREAIDADGWYHTGDVGRFVDGYLKITDRLKHMIVSKGGKNIYPGPIEDAFKSCLWIEQIMIVGEGREFLSALVVPQLDAIKEYAEQHGITHSTAEGLLHNDAVRELIWKDLRTYNKSAAAHEKVRDFRMILEPFTVENGMLTPTMKAKRRVIEKEYSGLVEDMYEDVV